MSEPKHPHHRVEAPPLLPPRTGVAGIRGMPRNPHSSFVYWELSPEDEARLAAAPGARVVLLEAEGEGSSAVVGDAAVPAGSRTRPARGGESYRHALALLHPDGGMDLLHASPRFTAPGGHGAEEDFEAVAAYAHRFVPPLDVG